VRDLLKQAREAASIIFIRTMDAGAREIRTVFVKPHLVGTTTVQSKRSGKASFLRERRDDAVASCRPLSDHEP